MFANSHARLVGAIACALVGAATTAAAVAQPVPEGVHSLGGPEVDVCGLTASDAAALEQQVRALPETRLLPASSPDYRSYSISDRRLLSFTTQSNRAHPAVVCRQVVAMPDERITIRTSISCRNDRANCDWLYNEFQALTRRTLDNMDRSQ